MVPLRGGSDSDDRDIAGSHRTQKTVSLADHFTSPSSSSPPPAEPLPLRRFNFGGFSSPPSHTPHPDYRDSGRPRKGSQPWKTGALFEVGIKLTAAKSGEKRDL